jgi:hypothetical protein
MMHDGMYHSSLSAALSKDARMMRTCSQHAFWFVLFRLKERIDGVISLINTNPARILNFICYKNKRTHFQISTPVCT